MRYYFRSRARGQAMAEFALLLPVLLLLTLGIFEFGRAYYAYSAIANAARESARYVVTNGADSPATKQALIDAGKNAAVGLGLSNANFLAECLDDTTPIPQISNTYCHYPYRIHVTVTYSFTAVAPLIPSFTMGRSATMRIEYSPP